MHLVDATRLEGWLYYLKLEYNSCMYYGVYRVSRTWFLLQLVFTYLIIFVYKYIILHLKLINVLLCFSTIF